MAAPIILCDTAGMTNEQWLEARMHGPHGKIPYTVGGSDVAAIFGVSPWTTPLELWNIKKGRMKPPKKANANQLEMGHLLEPIAAHWYAKKTGNIVTVDTNLYQHADHPYALANFDRRFTRVSDGVPGILECKSCTFHKSDEWADGAIPLYYELQLRFYLAVADVEIGAFSAIWGNNPDNDLAMPDIVRDRAKEDMIFEEGKFYTVMDVRKADDQNEISREDDEHTAEKRYRYGSYLRNTKNPVFLDFLKDEEGKLLTLKGNLEKQAVQSERAKESLKEVEEKLSLNREVQHEM